MSTDKQFEWNESLVREIVGIAHKDGYESIQPTGLDKMVEQFKQSKMPKQERIEVQSILMSDQFNKEGIRCYTLSLNRELTYGEGDKISKAIEQALNPTTDTNTGNNEYVAGWKDGFNQGVEFMAKPTESKASTNTGNKELRDSREILNNQETKKEEPKPEWEILSFKQDSNITDLWRKFSHGWCRSDNYGQPVTKAYGYNEILKNALYKIHSVKRLTDNSIWTSGDINIGKTIEKFHNGWNGMEIHYTDGSASLLMEETKLPTPTEQTKSDVLFTTFDGIPKYKGDKMFVLSTERWHSVECKACEHPFMGDKEQFKYFSTKEAADDYILRYKPVLCLNDCIVGLPQNLFDKIEQKAKQKLNKQTNKTINNDRHNNQQINF